MKPAMHWAAAAILSLALPFAAHSADQVKIGFVSTLSGPGGVLGNGIKEGFMLGLEHTGGKLGGLQTEVLVEDDQQKTDVAKQSVDKLIKRDKIDILTGIVFQNIIQAVQQTAARSKVFLISANSGPSDLAGANCNPYFFAVSWVSDSYSEASGKSMTDKGYKNVFTITPNYPGGHDVLNGFKRYYKGGYAGEAFTQLGQLDYSVEISQIRAAQPDAVFFFLPGGMGVNFIKQWHQAGMSKSFPLVGTGWSFDQDTIAAIGEPTLGALNTSHWNIDFDNAANKKFVADFEAKYKRLPTEYAAQGYDAALLIDGAIRKVDGKIEDKEAFRKALQSAPFESVRGEFKFNRNQFPIQNYYMREVVKDEKGQLVNKTIGTIFEDHQDAYVADCKM